MPKETGNLAKLCNIVVPKEADNVEQFGTPRYTVTNLTHHHHMMIIDNNNHHHLHNSSDTLNSTNSNSDQLQSYLTKVEDHHHGGNTNHQHHLHHPAAAATPKNTLGAYAFQSVGAASASGWWDEATSASSTPQASVLGGCGDDVGEEDVGVPSQLQSVDPYQLFGNQDNLMTAGSIVDHHDDGGTSGSGGDLSSPPLAAGVVSPGGGAVSLRQTFHQQKGPKTEVILSPPHIPVALPMMVKSQEKQQQQQHLGLGIDSAADSTPPPAPSPPPPLTNIPTTNPAPNSMTSPNTTNSPLQQHLVETSPFFTNTEMFPLPINSPAMLTRVPLGEKGRMELKAAIRAALKDHPELRERVNAVAKLRCATIPQLLQIAGICGLWCLALNISRRFMETRNVKHQGRNLRPRRAEDLQLTPPMMMMDPKKVMKLSHKHVSPPISSNTPGTASFGFRSSQNPVTSGVGGGNAMESLNQCSMTWGTFLAPGAFLFPPEDQGGGGAAATTALGVVGSLNTTLPGPADMNQPNNSLDTPLGGGMEDMMVVGGGGPVTNGLWDQAQGWSPFEVDCSATVATSNGSPISAGPTGNCEYWQSNVLGLGGSSGNQDVSRRW